MAVLKTSSTTWMQLLWMVDERLDDGERNELEVGKDEEGSGEGGKADGVAGEVDVGEGGGVRHLPHLMLTMMMVIMRKSSLEFDCMSVPILSWGIGCSVLPQSWNFASKLGEPMRIGMIGPQKNL